MWVKVTAPWNWDGKFQDTVQREWRRRVREREREIEKNMVRDGDCVYFFGGGYISNVNACVRL